MPRTLGPLVGRTQETRILREAVSRVCTGRPGAVEVVGDPGIGKTRLLAELAEHAAGRGALVLSGTASELERDLPFAAFVDALDEYVHALDPTMLTTLGSRVRAELAVVFPSMEQWAGAAEIGLQHERYRTHRAVRDLLEMIAARQPVVLVLDDVHWADWASAELLLALLRRPPAAGVLLAVGRRDRQTGRRLSAALDRAHRSGSLRRLEPSALTRAEARLLLGTQIAPDVADLVYRECGGNPLYLTEFARSDLSTLAASAAARPDVLMAGIEVPAGVAAAIHEELAVLPETTRCLLDGAAVAGDPFDLPLATAAAGLGASTTAARLDELVGLGMVRPERTPTRFRFRHPIVRRAVYDLTGAAWRIGAHQRCARAVNGSGGSVTSLAGHVERSATTGDHDAIEVLRRAGDQASLRAPASAARWYGAAADLLPADAPPEGRVALLLPRAAALAAVGEYDASYQCLAACLVLGAPGDDGLRIQLTASCASLEQLLGRHDQARQRLLAAIDALPEGDSPASVALRVELAMASYFDLRYDSMAARAREALAAAGRLSNTPLRAVAGSALALAESLSADNRAAEDCRATASVVDGTDDDVLLARLDAMGYLSFAELNLERFDDALRHADRVVRLCRSTGQGQLLPLVIPVQAAVHLVHGDLVRARHVIDDAVDAARLLAYDRATVWTLANRSAVRLAAGDVAGALADAQESAERVRPLDEGLVRGWTSVRLGGALLATGLPGQAVEALEDLGGGRDLADVQGGERVVALELLTRCHLAAEDPQSARLAARRAADRAAQFGLPLLRCTAARAEAAVHLADGRPGPASEAALWAADTTAAAGAPIEAAVSRTLAGRALAAAGHRDHAVRELTTAAEALHRHGAVALRDAAERELRRSGRAVHRRSRAGALGRSGINSLTGREHQIAELVSLGHTNATIAAELYLSAKTVESHLRNIFRKLDVSSRAQVAREVALR
ncbi:MAG: family ATPase [Aeromicrobium sp.]|uniref:helix-turn-helix transcriptional regulator n=1 Tax=Aeromicrobium sp. TaxID=1871063 RepID=UPI0026096495|nr:LuxR family transcriptional regulator [Aeromicrobium sp.]MCW2826294.1 family ATPase [Aeromicrobium sp.]